MVRKMMNLVYREVHGLHQAAYVLGVFAVGSQLLALVRDRLLAHQFGAGLELDLYYAAFRIPDLMYVIFASTLSVYVLIPFVAKRMRGEDSSQARLLLSQMLSVFLIVYIFLTFILWILVPYSIPFVFPGLSDEHETLTLLIRVLLLQPFFLGLSSLFGVVTQLTHRFVLYAISPLLYNVGIIIGIVFFYPLYGLVGLVYGVVLGAMAHFFVQVPLVQRSSLHFGITRYIQWQDVRAVLSVSIPRALTLSMHQVVFLVLIGLASKMTVGSVAVFQFAYNLQSVPLAVIGASYSTAAFPLLADLFAQKKLEQFRLYISTALRHIIFWSIPIIGLIIVLRAQMVRVVLGTGAFDWDDTRLTAAVLAVLAFSLLAQAANLLLIRTFYAAGQTRIPFIVTGIGSALSVIFSYVLYQCYLNMPAFSSIIDSVLRISGVEGTEVLVIALGYSLGIFIQTGVLFLLTVRCFDIATDWIYSRLLRSIFSAVCAAGMAYLTLNFFVEGLNTETFIGIFLQGLLGGITGLLGAIVGYAVVGSPELKEVYQTIHRRIYKTRVVASQDDVL